MPPPGAATIAETCHAAAVNALPAAALRHNGAFAGECFPAERGLKGAHTQPLSNVGGVGIPAVSRPASASSSSPLPTMRYRMYCPNAHAEKGFAIMRPFRRRSQAKRYWWDCRLRYRGLVVSDCHTNVSSHILNPFWVFIWDAQAGTRHEVLVTGASPV